MKVKVINGSLNSGKVNCGETTNLPDDEAKHLMEKGIVEAVTETKPTKEAKPSKEKATKKVKVVKEDS